MADEKRLRQILINLLSTSMQFTPPGGTIQLTADHLQGIAEVRIHGDGPGIPVEYMSEVFGEFSQLGPDREKQIAGPGLRLALGRKLVEMHGGRIHVENDSGKGMSFVFTLKTADR
jgi:signal transduction histidine kinase